MVPKTIAAVLGALLLLACTDASPTSNASNGVLQGQVTIGPLCPVETEDDPCLPEPSLFTSHKLVILSDGKEVQRVDIDGEGNYRTELPPGIYTVDYTPRDIGIPGLFKPPSAEIREGQTTILNIHIDTGIR
jgi:hypothetical protein